MYIEQGYKGKIGVWKFFVLPLGFIALMVLNYVFTVNSDIPVDEAMNTLVEQLGSNVVLISLLFPLAIGLFVVWGWVYLVNQQSLVSLTTSRKKVDFKRILFSFGVWSAITVILTLIGVYLAPDDYVFNFKLGPFITLFIIGIILIPMQTSFEEYLFRAHFMQGLGILAKNRWLPLFVTSILFGLMHAANPEVEKLGMGIMVYYIGTGLFLGILTLMDEGLELALGFHAANNLTAALLLTSDWSAFQTNSIFLDVSSPTLGWDVFIPVLVIYPALLIVFAKVYKWKNWNFKLFGKVLTKEEFTAETAKEHV